MSTPPPPPPRPAGPPKAPPRRTDVAARAEVIFDAAVELSNVDREAFLVAECGDDEDLLRRVRALFAAHKEGADFLEVPPMTPEIEEQLARLKPEEAGDRIGAYKLLQEIGEGGFGTVWMAEQEQPVRRRVALKIIKLGMDTKEVIARFEQERQALAMMDHPNIARVFDAGATQFGRPFFVMELVRGVKLTDYCDEQGLSNDERIQLFIHVCQAVQHAHQKGIIHRDLKPSNILVTINDGEPVPKVIDFGVAKATQGRLTEGTLFTKFEQMIGTPLYMSPEQAEMTSLDVDTRSDIYALGVLLYELLTGRTPIDTATMAQAGMDEIRRLIREVDPPRPSQRLKTLDGNELTTVAKRRHIEPAKLSGTLRGDLDWIVMKCLEKDRKRRYDTANGLALDLQRHLKNEVVVARPPTTGYLLSKLIKRNRSAVAAGGTVVLALIVGFAVAVWQARRAQNEARRAKTAEQYSAAALDELRATAPAFAEQARALAAKEQFADAIAKLDYAIKLRPDVAEFLVAKGDLLQCQLQLAEAAAIYREALRVKPGLARAEASAKLCDELLAAPLSDQGKLTRESLAKLHLAMQRQQRPAAELLPVARLLGEEKKLLLEYWLARLKDLPVSAEKPLKDRLTVREDGRLALDLRDTKVFDLSPLAGAPLAVLNVSSSKVQSELADLTPLRGLALTELNIGATSVADLSPLREMHTLEKLEMTGSKVTDLSPLSALRLKSLIFNWCAVSDLDPIRKMPLEEVNLRGTRVTDLSPLSGMPIKSIDLTSAPVLDFAPLAQLPLEKCYLQQNRITDLAVLRGKPLKELVLWGCVDARNYAVLAEIKTLELLLLPSDYRNLPPEDYAAIGSLRDHPKLRQLGSEITDGMGFAATGSKDIFWRNWDDEQGIVQALRAVTKAPILTRMDDGSWHVVSYDPAISNLEPLRGQRIRVLWIGNSAVSDLSPLRGMPLINLALWNTRVTDLSPLQGMPLEELHLSGTKVTDLSALRGMPLERLRLHSCDQLTDLSPLAESQALTSLTLPPNAKNFEFLRTLPKLASIGYQDAAYNGFRADKTPEEFWKEYDRQRWVRTLRESGLKTKTLKAHQDATWEVDLSESGISDLATLHGAPIRNLHLWNTPVADLTPLRGMPLQWLSLFGTKITDLGPLEGMPLGILTVSGTRIADISVLRGMPLKSLRLHNCTELTDLSPLAECKELKEVTLPPDAKNLEVLRALPKLERIGFREDPQNRFLPDKTAAEFWQEYDAKQK